ncbi:MAG: hypothetical protein JNM84_19195 [Planctomycetes bacterium]|nr:hypothetical protein [Planctomycetota bacterium]
MDTPDPEQELAIRLLEENREQFLADAREILAEDPHAKLVGTILGPGSSEAVAFRDAARKAGHEVPDEVVIATVLPRAFVLTILRANAPATLDWLESEPDKLPLLAAMKGGMQLGWTEL